MLQGAVFLQVGSMEAAGGCAGRRWAPNSLVYLTARV